MCSKFSRDALESAYIFVATHLVMHSSKYCPTELFQVPGWNATGQSQGVAHRAGGESHHEHKPGHCPCQEGGADPRWVGPEYADSARPQQSASTGTFNIIIRCLVAN